VCGASQTRKETRDREDKEKKKETNNERTSRGVAVLYRQVTITEFFFTEFCESNRERCDSSVAEHRTRDVRWCLCRVLSRGFALVILVTEFAILVNEFLL